MTSLLLLQFACRRKYKCPNMLSSTSVFLGLSFKAVSPTLAMEKVQTLEWNNKYGRSVEWKSNNSTILPLHRESMLPMEDSRLSCTLESLHCTNVQTYLLHGTYFWRQKREMKNLSLSLPRALFNSKMLIILDLCYHDQFELFGTKYHCNLLLCASTVPDPPAWSLTEHTPKRSQAALFGTKKHLQLLFLMAPLSDVSGISLNLFLSFHQKSS